LLRKMLTARKAPRRAITEQALEACSLTSVRRSPLSRRKLRATRVRRATPAFPWGRSNGSDLRDYAVTYHATIIYDAHIRINCGASLSILADVLASLFRAMKRRPVFSAARTGRGRASLAVGCC